MYTPSRKKKKSTPANILCISIESPFRPAMASPNIWRFFKPPKGKKDSPWDAYNHCGNKALYRFLGELGGSVVECRTPEREVRGSRPTAAVLCPWARHFTPRKYWLITQEAMAPSRYDWKIVDWDVKPQHNQPIPISCIYWAINVHLHEIAT